MTDRPGRLGRGPAPRQLGDYLILREIGRGGMGVVYESVQQSLGRHVALKVLPHQALAGSSQLERFRLEARAAARLHHTNIVPVFGVGECDGVHYYAMQFIQGQGLDVVIDALRGLRERSRASHRGRRRRPGSSRRRGPARDGRPDPGALDRPLRRRAGGAETRPGTGAEPTAAADTARTSPPSQDPASPAPGQASRSTPSDVGRSSELSSGQAGRAVLPQRRPRRRPGGRGAGLCARPGHPPSRHQAVQPAPGRQGDRVGHRLRARQGRGGRRPDAHRRYRRHAAVHGAGTVRRLVRPAERRLRPGGHALRAADASPAVRGVEPSEADRAGAARRARRRPGSSTAASRSDLETIVLKALAKEPGQRYATAEQMAEDLRRFAADRPILARRITTAERAWRWCKRNPALAGLMATVATLLVAVALGATLSAVRWSAPCPNRWNPTCTSATSPWPDRELSMDNLGRAQKLLDDCPPGLRQWEWYYLERLCRFDPGAFTDSAPVGSVAYSSDGNRLASAGLGMALRSGTARQAWWSRSSVLRPPLSIPCRSTPAANTWPPRERTGR